MLSREKAAVDWEAKQNEEYFSIAGFQHIPTQAEINKAKGMSGKERGEIIKAQTFNELHAATLISNKKHFTSNASFDEVSNTQLTVDDDKVKR